MTGRRTYEFHFQLDVFAQCDYPGPQHHDFVERRPPYFCWCAPDHYATLPSMRCVSTDADFRKLHHKRGKNRGAVLEIFVFRKILLGWFFTCRRRLFFFFGVFNLGSCWWGMPPALTAGFVVSTVRFSNWKCVFFWRRFVVDLCRPGLCVVGLVSHSSRRQQEWDDQLPRSMPSAVDSQRISGGHPMLDSRCICQDCS